jgi:putative hydrolase of the HAD superfamily
VPEKVNNKYILLDIDSVLIDPFQHGSESQYVWTANIEEDLGIKTQTLGKLFNDQWPDVITGKLQLTGRVAQYLEDIESPISAETFIEYWFSNDGPANEAMLAFIEKVKSPDVSISLATNQENQRVNYLLRHQLSTLKFDNVFSSATLGHKKPSPDFFTIIQDRLGANADQIVLIDDTEANLDAARSLGMMAIQYSISKPRESFFQELTELIEN